MQIDELRKLLVNCGLVELSRVRNESINAYLYFKPRKDDELYDEQQSIAKIGYLTSEPILTLSPFYKTSMFKPDDKYRRTLHLENIKGHMLYKAHLDFINKWSKTEFMTWIDNTVTMRPIQLNMISYDLCKAIVLDIIHLHKVIENSHDIENIMNF